jgi:factor associated with neutral sphingomyelinase activation
VVIHLENNQGVKAWIQTLMNLNRSIPMSGLDHIYEISKMLMMHFNFKTLDMNRLESINEVPMFKDEIFIKHIQPLTINYGFLLVTNINMYIQPVTTKEDKIIRFNQKKIQRMFKRRHNLKDLAIEMFTQDGESYFLAFDGPEIRDKIFEVVRHRSPGCKTNIDVDLEELTENWKSRELSNYEYLLKLNEFAQRSLNDLSQYPVFPWVLQDYTSEELDLKDPKVFRDLSKPIGALNEDRLKGFIERSQYYSEGQVYLYGTHYSSPFYVVGYLVRQYPLYMLHLNNGRFDRSDRIFNSIAEDWKVGTYHRALHD